MPKAEWYFNLMLQHTLSGHYFSYTCSIAC